MKNLIFLLTTLLIPSLSAFSASSDKKKVSARYQVTPTMVARISHARLVIPKESRGMTVNVSYIIGSFQQKIKMTVKNSTRNSIFNPGDIIVQAKKTKDGFEITEVKDQNNMSWTAYRNGNQTGNNKILLQAKGKKFPEFYVERVSDSDLSLIKTNLQFIDSNNSQHVGEALSSAQPRWDRQAKCYRLCLGGTTNRASKRNSRFEDSAGEPILIIGRLDDRSLNMYFRHPFSPVQAFAVALATL